MITRQLFVKMAMLLSCGMAFAAPGTKFFTLTEEKVTSQARPGTVAKVTGYNLYLRQADTGCEAGRLFEEGTCLGSVANTPENLFKLLDEQWVNHKGDPGTEVPSLTFMTDIDLLEFSAKTAVGKCEVNHVAWPVPTGAVINGNNKTVKNLCFVSDKPMTNAMGLFELVDGTNVSNLKIDNVRMSVGGSNDGADYYPMGAFAGITNMTTVQNVTVSNVDIQGPVAGGIVGLLKTSTLKSINNHKNISVTNNVTITKGYAGSKTFESFSLSRDSVSSHDAFVGGLVGVILRAENAGDPSLDNVFATVTVKDLAKGHKSAVGGIAGVYKTVGETISGVGIGRKIVPATCGWGGYCTPASVSDATEASEISGGSSMGGLFGAVVVYNNYEYNTDDANKFHLTMKNCAFKGSISDASVYASEDAGRVMAVGGIVGWDSLQTNDMSLSIEESNAEATIQDSVETAGNYYYYAGGITGYGDDRLCNNGVKDASAAMSFSNNTASGSINIKASSSDIEGLHVQTFVGGVVGTACLSQSAKNFVGNTSSVDIALDIKTVADENLVTNGANVYDTLIVGGLAGFVATGLTTTLQVSKDVFKGSISVEDNLNTTMIGGIIGGTLQRGVNTQGNGHKIDFASMKVEKLNEKFVDYKMNSATKPYSALQISRVGGICGFCSELEKMDLISVMGSIEVSGNSAGDSLLVGGLAGSLYASEATLAFITRSFVNGDIAVSANAANKKVGFMIGSAVFNKGCALTSNYHYGENDADVTMPAGALYRGGELAETWMSSINVSYTVRNGAAENLDEIQFNGTKLAANMKVDEFTKFLKAPYANIQNQGWVRLDGKNNDLPYVEGDASGCDAGSFLVNYFDKDLSLTKHECVPTGKTIQKFTTEDVAYPDSMHCTGWRVLDANKDTVDFDLKTPIDAEVNLYAKYELNTYTVTFTKGGSAVGSPKVVAHGESVEFPTVSGGAWDSLGYNFVGWNDSVSVLRVIKNLDIGAVYDPKVTYYTYLNADTTVFKQESYTYPAKREVIPDGPEMVDGTGVYEFKFLEWISVESEEYVGNVYQALYDTSKAVYTIVFKDKEGNVYGDTLRLEYGEKIEYPNAQKPGKELVGWLPEPEFVTKSEEIIAFFVDVKSSSSVEAESSSSSVVPESSSSSSSESVLVKKEMITDTNTVHQESYSKAVKLEFSIKDADPKHNTDVALIVRREGSEDSIAKAMTFDGIASIDTAWELTVSAAGNYTADFVIANGAFVDSVKFSFVVEDRITVTQNSWNMVAMSAIKSQKQEWGKGGAFFWWDESNPVGDYWQYKAYAGESAEDTKGFWYGTSAGTPLVIEGVANCKDSMIVWGLKNVYSGWNLVANPCGWSVDLSKGENDSGEKVVFWQWNAAKSDYDSVKVIGPYSAVWVNVKKATTWRMPSAPSFNVVTKKMSAEDKFKSLRKSALRKASSKNWSVLAVLSDNNGKTDSWNILGAGETSETTLEPPSGMGDRVNLYVKDGKEALAKSVKAVADEYEWTLNVNASTNREGKISFEGVDELQAAGLHLYVTVDGVTSEVKPGESVKVALTKSYKQVNVRVASAPKAIAVASQINGFRAVKAADGLQMQFETTGDLAGAASRYALVDVKGKVIASGNFSASAGSNSITVAAPKAGVYFMKLKVGSQMSSAKVLVK